MINDFGKHCSRKKCLLKSNMKQPAWKLCQRHQESWVILFAHKFIFKIVKPTTDKTEQHKQWEKKHFLTHKNSYRNLDCFKHKTSCLQFYAIYLPLWNLVFLPKNGILWIYFYLKIAWLYLYTKTSLQVTYFLQQQY